MMGFAFAALEGIKPELELDLSKGFVNRYFSDMRYYSFKNVKRTSQY